MNNFTLSVSQLNHYVKSLLDGDNLLSNVFVEGEISNFTNHYRSGHLYMSLKDENAVIRAVMFKSSASMLKFLPRDGMRVICRGRVSLYDRDGQYQLYIEDMQPNGAGALSIAFEQLKEKLNAEGLFSADHKKPLPRFPKSIAVITSPTGAAVQDILNVLNRRYPIARVIMCPVKVQGEGAAEQIAAAVKTVDRLKCADVIIVGRGGGSLEELWAFNDETLARTIFACNTPVISAVGHETDFSICDFVSDLRAPTPSAAAELAVPDKTALYNGVITYSQRLARILENRIKTQNEKRLSLSSRPCLKNPRLILDAKSEHADRVFARLLAAQKALVFKNRSRCGSTEAKLSAFNPLSLLARGFIIAKKDAAVVKSAEQLETDDRITLILADGRAECTVNEILTERHDVI